MHACLLVLMLTCGGVPRREKALNFAQFGLSMADTYTTQRLFHTCTDHCREADPLTRDFQSHGAPLASSATYAASVGVDYLARRMRRSDNRVYRKLWWLPQVAVAAADIFGIQNNLRYKSSKSQAGPIQAGPTSAVILTSPIVQALGAN